MTEPPASDEVGPVEAVEAAVEGLPGAVSLAPSATMPSLGGELVLPAGGPGTPAGDVGTDTVRAGLLQAGPLAVAGLVANGANLVVTVLLAHLLTSRGYGEMNQLTGLFLIVSMPGSAVVVAVVRRITGWSGSGSARLVRRWSARIHARGTMAVAVFALVVLAARSWFAHTIGQRDPVGAVLVLVAGAVWILLSFDRGLLQAHRDYRALAGNLLVEGGVRLVAMLVLVGAGLGVSGAALGMLVAEVVTCVHARVRADGVWAAEGSDAAPVPAAPVPAGPDAAGPAAGPGIRRLAPGAAWRRVGPVLRPAPDLRAPDEERRALVHDLVSGLVALGMVALLQNIDVIVVGREDPGRSGSYAAVSVACKALVFGAIVLGGYLLPEAAIRWRQGGHALRQLAVTLLVLAVPAGALLLVAAAGPTLLLRVVFSPKDLGAGSAFLPLVLAMVCLSTTVILTMYLLAVGRRWITVVLVAGGVAVTVAVVHAGGGPLRTAQADLAVQAALTAVTGIGFAAVHHRRTRVAPDYAR